MWITSATSFCRWIQLKKQKKKQKLFDERNDLVTRWSSASAFTIFTLCVLFNEWSFHFARRRVAEVWLNIADQKLIDQTTLLDERMFRSFNVSRCSVSRRSVKRCLSFACILNDVDTLTDVARCFAFKESHVCSVISHFFHLQCEMKEKARAAEWCLNILFFGIYGRIYWIFSMNVCW